MTLEDFIREATSFSHYYNSEDFYNEGELHGGIKTKHLKELGLVDIVKAETFFPTTKHVFLICLANHEL